MNGDHREFLLAAMRTACLRCDVMKSEVTQIGVALKADLIGPEAAIQWLMSDNLMFLLEPVPAWVGDNAVLSASSPNESDVI